MEDLDDIFEYDIAEPQETTFRQGSLAGSTAQATASGTHTASTSASGGLNDLAEIISYVQDSRRVVEASTHKMQQRIDDELHRQDQDHPGESAEQRKERWGMEIAEQMQSSSDLRPNRDWMCAVNAIARKS